MSEKTQAVGGTPRNNIKAHVAGSYVTVTVSSLTVRRVTALKPWLIKHDLEECYCAE